MTSEEKINYDISKAKHNDAKFIVVSIDWDTQTDKTPGKDQVKIAHYVANAGADIIVGNNKNSPLPIDIISVDSDNGNVKNVPVAYSLGNLISSQRNSIAQTSSILLRFDIKFNKTTNISETMRLSYVPLYTWKNIINSNDNYITAAISSNLYPEDNKYSSFIIKVKDYLHNMFKILPIEIINN